MDINCELCPDSLLFRSADNSGDLLAECWELFHQPCVPCSLTASQSQALCVFCQHLRLRHLVTCVPHEKWQKFLVLLRKGLVEDTMLRCPFCDIIRHQLQQIFDEHTLLEHTSVDNFLYLGLGQFHAEGVIAEIHWKILEHNRVSLVSSGKIHMERTINS